MFRIISDYFVKTLVFLLLVTVFNYQKKLKFSQLRYEAALIIGLVLFYFLHYEKLFLITIIITLWIIYNKISSVRIVTSFCYGTLFYLYFYLIEALFALFLYFIYQDKRFLLIDKKIEFVSYLVALASIFIFIYIFNKMHILILDLRRAKVSIFLVIEAIIITIILFILNIFFQSIEKTNYLIENKLNGAIIIGISILILIIGMVLYSVTIYGTQLHKTVLLQQKFAKMQKHYFETLKNNNNDLRKFRHDIRNHFNSLHILMEEENYDKAKAYLKEICDEFEMINQIIKTGNVDADLILNNKFQLAKKRKIEFIVKGRLPQEVAISMYDLCTIFSNILDNAIEANERIDGERYIHIRLGYYNEFMSISIINPCKEYNNAKTLKQDTLNHGLGLSNVKDVLTKYRNSDLKLYCNNGGFKIDLIINYKQGAPK